MSKEKKIGSISIKNGHIWTTTEDEDIEIDLAYVKEDMKKAIRTTGRNSLYVMWVRNWMNELNNAGLRAIPNIMDRLCALTGMPKTSGFSFGGKQEIINPDFRSASFANTDNNPVVGGNLKKSGAQKHKEEKSIGLGTELTAKICFKRWYSWLNLIRFQGSSRKKSWSDPNKVYTDNFDKALKEPEIISEQKVA
jgi:hypothetical protein